MVSVEEATTIILSNLYTPPVIRVPLVETAGCVLAEVVHADRDFPPFDRVTMDGIGVSYKQLKEGQREFIVESIQPAGVPRKHLEDNTRCIEVMTGAMVPEGIDTVIRYEDVAIKDGVAKVENTAFQPLQNIHAKGLDARKGDVLLSPGIILSPAEIALLASVGKSPVAVKQFPRLAVISTGDELVDVDTVPEMHQVRRSNGYALQAAARPLSKVFMHHLADDEKVIEDAVRVILKQSDVIVLSGGVSKGKFDFVPKVLEKLGVQKLFHQVNQRPGKPFWFGVSSEGKTVFALPGNPVSTFMCFHKYVRPWLLLSAGVKLSEQSALLAEDFTFEPSLTYFLQVKIQTDNGRLMAYPAPGGGSGDFANLSEVDGFLQLPAEKTIFKKGESYPFICFR